MIDQTFRILAICARADEFTRDMICAGAGRRILKRAGVGGNCCEQTIGNRFCNRPFGGAKKLENEFTGGRFLWRNPVDISISRIALMMVDVNEQFPIGYARSDSAKPFKTRRVCGDNAVKLHSPLWFLNNL